MIVYVGCVIVGIVIGAVATILVVSNNSAKAVADITSIDTKVAEVEKVIAEVKK